MFEVEDGKGIWEGKGKEMNVSIARGSFEQKGSWSFHKRWLEMRFLVWGSTRHNLFYVLFTIMIIKNK